MSLDKQFMTAYSGTEGSQSNDRSLEDSLDLENPKATLGNGRLIRVYDSSDRCTGLGHQSLNRKGNSGYHLATCKHLLEAVQRHIP